jgi:hypothetical protein
MINVNINDAALGGARTRGTCGRPCDEQVQARPVPVRLSMVEAGLTATGWRATLEIVGQRFWCCECPHLHTSTGAAISCGMMARRQMALENA